MNITRGKIQTALKVVVYGPEGIGKSTFAARFPAAVFIDTEGSTTHMDVARFDRPEKWTDILDAVDWAAAHPDQVGTVVIDTADWAEKLATRYVCKEESINKSGDTRGWDNIEAPGYGKGYVYLKAAYQVLLDKAQKAVESGVNVVFTAHAILKKFEQPDEMGSYDRWSLKLNEKNVAPLVKEWADMVLFANYKTDVVKTSDGKTKGRGGQKRVMYTTHSACWDAKNRFGLEDQLPFEYDQIAHLFADDRGPVAEVHEEQKKETPVKAPERPQERVKPKADISTATVVPAPQPAQEQEKLMNSVVPGGGGRKKKAEKEEIPKELPEMMRSDNPEKAAALKKLWEKMRESGVPDPLIVMAVVAEKDYYDISTQIRDYDLDFINDVLIEAWDQVNSLCQTKICDLPF